MTKLKGRITQIISPGEISHYLWRASHSFLKGKYFIVLEREDIPQNFIARFLHGLRHLAENPYWNLLSDSCEYKVGDIVEFDVDICYNSADFLMVAR